MTMFSGRAISASVVAFVTMFAAATVCEARQAHGPQTGWMCRADHMSNSPPCRGAGCESLWRDHLRHYHASEPPQVQQQLEERFESSSIRPPATLGQAYVRGITSASGLGVLLASLKTDSNGTNQWRKGLIAGPAIGVVMVTAANARSIPARIRIPLLVGGGLIAGGVMFGGSVRW